MNDTTVLSKPGLEPESRSGLPGLWRPLSLPARHGGNRHEGDHCLRIVRAVASEKDWTLELGSGVAWSNVRSGQPNQPYTLVPMSLTASLKLDDVSLDHFLGGWLRGYSEFYFRGEYEQIVHGPENHYEGIMVGPRYNFVQPGWVIIPYVEGGVGLGFADSNPQAGGLGQDFNFTFEAGAGAKYNIY